MIGGILNQMRQQAQRSTSADSSARVGQITSYDPTTHSVRVELQPDGLLSGWLPMAAQFVGNGWGLVAAPSVGDMVVVAFVDSDIDAGIVVARLFNDDDRAPSVPAGEFWLVHKSGSSLKFLDSGNVELVSPGAVHITADTATIHANTTIDGQLTVKQKLTAEASVEGYADAVFSGQVTGQGIPLSTHRHPGVRSGSDTSQGPTL
jgi:phage baseplate assembly protein V